MVDKKKKGRKDENKISKIDNWKLGKRKKATMGTRRRKF